MAHATLWGEIRALIQPLHIRFAIKRLEVTICVDRLNDAGVAPDIHKPIASESHLKPFFSPALDLHRRLKWNCGDSRMPPSLSSRMG
jgi:hypothetical protein